MRRSVAQGLHSSIWEDNPLESGRRHQARAARFISLRSKGLGTFAAHHDERPLAALAMTSPGVYKQWSPAVLSRKYDFSQKPAFRKQGVTLGMGMTGKTGRGTDVRANATRAEPAIGGAHGGLRAINGSCRRRCRMLFDTGANEGGAFLFPSAATGRKGREQWHFSSSA